MSRVNNTKQEMQAIPFHSVAQNLVASSKLEVIGTNEAGGTEYRSISNFGLVLSYEDRMTLITDAVQLQLAGDCRSNLVLALSLELTHNREV